MRANHKIHCAVTAILGAHAAAAYAAEPADTTAASEESAPSGFSEVVVTAQRRTENVQDVPITIQALTAETLTQFNVDDVR